MRKVCLFGASPQTGNLGVSALCYSALRGLYKNLPDLRATVFDDSGLPRSLPFESDGRSHVVDYRGGLLSRRVWRQESLWNIRWSCMVGGAANPGARSVCESDAVLDVSGGDSFTDLYGPKRFRGVTLSKDIALACGKPLILLPQTYGPFVDRRTREEAKGIIRRAGMAWARDKQSFETLREMLGSAFDPSSHRCGVDMAFGLEVTAPPAGERQSVSDFLRNAGDVPVIGFNVSGLVFNDPQAGARQYGLKADYPELVNGFLAKLLSGADVRVVLVPHVVTPPGHFESDIDACNAVAALLGERYAGRVLVAPAFHDPRHAKWLIGQFAWFCGTRMHATIAGLSTGVPTAAVAYSLKTQGVFESCGQGAHVADARALDAREVIDVLWKSWESRAATRADLANRVPRVVEACESQMRTIAEHVRRVGSETARAG